MAANPIVRFEHIWHALMRVLGQTHPRLYSRNKAIIDDMRQLMGRR